MQEGMHSWHVHEKSMTDPKNGTVCALQGPHYDPLEMGPRFVGESLYSRNCSPSNPNKLHGCEVGDLSGKFGMIISFGTDIFETYTDTNLPLTGPAGIINKSLLIHGTENNADEHICAPIVKIHGD